MLTAAAALRRPLLAALLALPALAPALRATTYTWKGDTSNDWSVAANWQENAAPVSSLTDTDIVYNTSGYAFPNLDSGYSIHSLTFNSSNSTAYDFNYGSLTLGGGGLNQRDGRQADTRQAQRRRRHQRRSFHRQRRGYGPNPK